MGWPAEAFHRPGQDDVAFGGNVADPFHGHEIRILSSTPPPSSDPQLWAGGSTSKGPFAYSTVGSPFRGHDIPEQDMIRRALEFLHRPLPSMQPASCTAHVAALPKGGFLRSPLGDPGAWPQETPESHNGVQSVGHNYFYSDIDGKAEVQESETQCNDGDCRTFEHRVLPHAQSRAAMHGGNAHQMARPDLPAGAQRPPRLRMAWDALDDIAHQAFSTVGRLLNQRMVHLPDAEHWQVPHGLRHSQNQSHEFMYSDSNSNRGYTETVTRCRDGHCETTKRVVEPFGEEADNGLQSNVAEAKIQMQPSPATATTGDIGTATAENASPVEQSMDLLQKPEIPHKVESQDEPEVKEG